MAGILYRCVSCGGTHEVARRPDGPVYLRCPVTYRWAWHEARAFEAARPAGGSAHTAGTARGVKRGATAGRSAARAASRGRGTAERASSRTAGVRARRGRPAARRKARR